MIILLGGMWFSLKTFAQTTTLSTGLNPVGAANDPCGTNNVQVYGFSYNATSGSPSFTGLINWTTSGTYVAADIANFKLYQTNFSVFNTTNLLATLTTGLGPGTHSFPAFTYTWSAAATRYFWVTVDINASAVGGHTLTFNALTGAMTSITGTENIGTVNAGGMQTITCALPVELTSFTGQAKFHQNVLEWTTASEINNAYFTIEKSADGLNFDELAYVNARGNSNISSSYSTIDPSPDELTYYRLKQTDFDGVFTYSEIIAVRLNDNDPDVFPNPADNTLNFKNLDSNYYLYDAKGSIVLTGITTHNNKLDISWLQNGLYMLVFENGYSRKILIRH